LRSYQFYLGLGHLTEKRLIERHLSESTFDRKAHQTRFNICIPVLLQINIQYYLIKPPNHDRKISIDLIPGHLLVLLNCVDVSTETVLPCDEISQPCLCLK
jgi:hypothetical protein